MTKPDPGNLYNVAKGNYICSCTGAPINEMDPECPAHKGFCLTCGCPPDKMPMVFRGTGWCCDLHRKEQQKEEE